MNDQSNQTTPDKLAVASRKIGRILQDLEADTGAAVSGLGLESIDQVAGRPSNSAGGVLLSVRIELKKPQARVWEIG